MDSFLSGPLSFRIVDTVHGPEVVVFVTGGLMGMAQVATFTVGEFEALTGNAGALSRTARARLTAKTHLKNLPMKR